METLELARPTTPTTGATNGIVPAWPGRRHVLELDDFSPAEIAAHFAPMPGRELEFG